MRAVAIDYAVLMGKSRSNATNLSLFAP